MHERSNAYRQSNCPWVVMSGSRRLLGMHVATVTMTLVFFYKKYKMRQWSDLRHTDLHNDPGNAAALQRCSTLNDTRVGIA